MKNPSATCCLKSSYGRAEIDYGEGGILRRRVLQYRTFPVVMADVPARQVFGISSIVRIVCGCFALIGIVVSTVSAHGSSTLPPIEGLPLQVPATLTLACEEDERRFHERGHRLCAASYSRYSSDHQNTASIDDQQRECRQQAERDGFFLLPECEFSDKAISGTKRNRAGLNELLRAAERKQFSVLYFHSLSRLGRESVITMPLLKQLVHVHGIRVISIVDGVDTNNKGWEMMATFCSLQNEQYIRDLSANVFRGQEGTVIANLGVGDQRFGYHFIPSPNVEKIGRGCIMRSRVVYAVHEENARWVKCVFDWFVRERRPLAWIVRRLNRENAPTDHRSTTGKWSRNSVISLLRSKKYIGLWQWGVHKNVRNPITGMVTQVRRKPIDISGHDRDFPHLQIIENDIFRKAQSLLDANNEAYATHRGEKKRLTGAPKGRHTGHLLSNMMRCTCGSVLYVGGSGGKYLFCPKAGQGLCQCKTQLPRALAAKLILDAVGQRVLENPTWVNAILDLMLKAWQQATSVRPHEVDGLQSQVNQCETKIRRLVTQMEDSERPIPGITKRLEELEREKELAREKLSFLKSATTEQRPAPDLEWATKRLMELGNVLNSATPAAGPALRGLLKGPIQLTEIAVPGKKRSYWRGEFRIVLMQVAHATDPGIRGLEPEMVPEFTETITIDFRHSGKWAEKCSEAWELHEQGVPVIEIGKRLGIPKSKIGMVLDAAAAERGQIRIDGRKRRHSDKYQGRQKFEREQFIDAVKQLWDAKLENQEIADRLGVCRDTITVAIRDWHTSRGLPVPDGRTRRWRLAPLDDTSMPPAASQASDTGPLPEAVTRTSGA
eukprot:TRINITY_DN496_c1_g4_i1.p1 TRINITY_DN496_c1_g4~~TRINITY_DN496_c1_g4_i1.p1  ORF type:complete len:836 (+),score=76.62 TRINITY_DN496_c1_g4_i1:1158-3665(+)